jgi:chitinase
VAGDLKFLSSLKLQNPLLKVLVSVRPADKTFSLESNSTTVAANVKSKFAKRLRDFLSRHNVDGVDLDWEFFRENDKSANGREALVSLVRVLRATLRQPVAGSPDQNFLVTLTSSKFPRDLTENYDFNNLHK